MYLNYDEYKQMGGTLDEAAFINYGFEANQQIMTATHNRISEPSAAVKNCMFKLIGLLSKSDENLQKGQISSFAHDGLSQNFALPTAADFSKAVHNVIYTYLIHEVDENNVPLLYAGVSNCD